jgi:hypothetical protein
MLIGADPEFELHNAHGFVSAAQAFIHAQNTTQVGLDGCANTGEFRPNPGTPAAVTASFRHHLSYLSRAVGEGVQAYAGSGIHVPTGGHIHFSGVPNTEAFRNLLDRVVSIPLNNLSKPDNSAMRTQTHHYGVLSSYRDQPWGWEYRAPLSWICHPIVCRGTLELAWQAATLFLDAIMKLETSESVLNCITSPTDLLSYVTDKQASLVIEKFFDFAKEMKANNIYLEDFELFQSWKIRKTRFSEGYETNPNILRVNYPRNIFSRFTTSNYIGEDQHFLDDFITYPTRMHHNRTVQVAPNSEIHFTVIPPNHPRYVNDTTVVIAHGREAVPSRRLIYDGRHDNILSLPYTTNYYRQNSVTAIQRRIWGEIISRAFQGPEGIPFNVEIIPTRTGATEIFFPMFLMSSSTFQDSRFPAYLALYLFGNPDNPSFLYRGEIINLNEENTPAPDTYLESVNKFLSYKPKRSQVCVV